jgi:hypothetical protein
MKLNGPYHNGDNYLFLILLCLIAIFSKIFDNIATFELKDTV